MDWSFDIAAAPKGKFVTQQRNFVKGARDIEVFEPDRVILATKCGTVTVSRWLPPQPDRPEGRWEMLATGEQPIAWMAFPTHPHAQVEAEA
jgi:hypothetical protein